MREYFHFKIGKYLSFALMWCGIHVMCPFLMKPWFSLQYVIVEFPGHIHL